MENNIQEAKDEDFNEEGVTFVQNPLIDLLFGYHSGIPVPPKHIKYQPLGDLKVLRDDGSVEILKDVLQRQEDKDTIKEFRALFQDIARNIFNEGNIIKKPNKVEVVLSISHSLEAFEISDVDNLSKTVLDALTGIAYDDDSQVTTLIVQKDVYHTGLLVGITKLNAPNRGFSSQIVLFGEKPTL